MSISSAVIKESAVKSELVEEKGVVLELEKI